MPRFVQAKDDFDPATTCGLCGGPLDENGDSALLDEVTRNHLRNHATRITKESIEELVARLNISDNKVLTVRQWLMKPCKFIDSEVKPDDRHESKGA